jgi:hypothetical protein
MPTTDQTTPTTDRAMLTTDQEMQTTDQATPTTDRGTQTEILKDQATQPEPIYINSIYLYDDNKFVIPLSVEGLPFNDLIPDRVLEIRQWLKVKLKDDNEAVFRLVKVVQSPTDYTNAHISA